MNLQWPDDIPPTTLSTFHLAPNGAHVISPLTGAMQSVVRSGARWVATLEFNVVTQAKARRLMALLAGIGYGNRIMLSDWSLPTPLGAWSGSPLVNGAVAAGATTVVLDGATISILNWAKAGDVFQLTNPVGRQTQLCLATFDADSDGSGNVTLYFQAPLRFALEDNAYIHVTNTGSTLQDEAGNDLVDEDGNSLSTGPLAQAKFALPNPSVPRSATPGAYAGALTIELIEDVT